VSLRQTRALRLSPKNGNGFDVDQQAISAARLGQDEIDTVEEFMPRSQSTVLQGEKGCTAVVGWTAYYRVVRGVVQKYVWWSDVTLILLSS
jgi:hypothetical protein